MKDIQSLNNIKVEAQEFQMGEALAEIFLKKYFNCRFYWNRLRDTLNPKAILTGPDLVGFIEVDNEVLFLFGEVKTSSEEKSPPQVMTNPNGLENQIIDLFKDQQKRLNIIIYLSSKINKDHFNDFKNDFDKASKNYYKPNSTYVLFGVLVRDTKPNEDDVKISYEKLSNIILKPVGIQLLSLYLKIPKSQWLSMINGVENETL